MTTAKPSLYDVENAFQPAKEVSDIDRFAGRAKPVRDAFLALMADGASIAIVGNRVRSVETIERRRQMTAEMRRTRREMRELAGR